jgi:hypothetical protein
MAKINLLTMHYGTSYGAAMQTYATCRILRDIGHKVTIINLQEKKRSNIKALLKKQRFERFYKKHYPAISSRMFEPNIEMLPEADFYLVGSDQVWNPDITKSLLNNYFLDFVPEGIKRISYASSFGKDKWNQYVSKDDIKNISNELNKFASVSVREKSGVDICDNILGIKSTQVLDPTLLFDDYNELIENPHTSNEMSCFFIGFKSNRDFFTSVVESVKSKLGLKASYLDATTVSRTFEKHYFSPSPNKWITNLYNSKFIITSSFHGLAFALIFRKPFIVLKADPLKVIRLKSLLKLIGLEYRLIENIEDFESKHNLLKEPINFTEVFQKIDIERNTSMEFLYNAFSD